MASWSMPAAQGEREEAAAALVMQTVSVTVDSNVAQAAVARRRQHGAKQQ
jgi:hypothetical protein